MDKASCIPDCQDLKISAGEIRDALAAVARTSPDIREDCLCFLGAQKNGRFWSFNFFDRSIELDGSAGFEFTDHSIPLAVRKVLVSYLCLGMESGASETGFQGAERSVTLRELAGGNPLFAGFTGNIAKTIEQTYTGRADELQDRCIALGGKPVKEAGFDLNIRFAALSRVPMIFRFNDRDDILPATAVFLYPQQAVEFLDLTSLGILCTSLVGRLI